MGERAESAVSRAEERGSQSGRPRPPEFLGQKTREETAAQRPWVSDQRARVCVCGNSLKLGKNHQQDQRARCSHRAGNSACSQQPDWRKQFWHTQNKHKRRSHLRLRRVSPRPCTAPIIFSGGPKKAKLSSICRTCWKIVLGI